MIRLELCLFCQDSGKVVVENYLKSRQTVDCFVCTRVGQILVKDLTNDNKIVNLRPAS